MPSPAKTTTQRGYGSQHQRIRRATLTQAYGQPCPHCGESMLPGQAIDLDHTIDRTSYRGFAHASCNRADGARRGNAQRSSSINSRDW